VLSEAKKKYTSDYILNKAAEVGLGMMHQSENQSSAVNSELANLVNSIDQNFKPNHEKKSLPTAPVQINGTTGRKLPVPVGRQLPQVNPTSAKSQIDKVKYNTYIHDSSSAQSVPELARDNESFLCSNNNNDTRVSDNHNPHSMNNSEDTNNENKRPDYDDMVNQTSLVK